jgi:predicted DNA-binding mobile mystery protein A
MKTLERSKVARQALDARFHEGNLASLANRPVNGWIRAIREALSMNSRQLAAMLNISQPGVIQLERSESAGTIQLNTLRRVADALDCELVYALVPRTSLEETVQSKARTKALKDISMINKTMRLENQGLQPEQLEQRIHDYATKIIASGGLWDTPES